MLILFCYAAAQVFSPVEMPSLSYLNLRGNPLEQNSVSELLQILKGFSCMNGLEVSFLTHTLSLSPAPLDKQDIYI